MKKRVPEKLFSVQNARLDLRSLVMLFAFVGFFAGVVYGAASILYAFATYDDGLLGVRLFLALISPINFSLGLAISAVIGYPLYKLCINRYLSQRVSGYDKY